MTNRDKKSAQAHEAQDCAQQQPEQAAKLFVVDPEMQEIDQDRKDLADRGIPENSAEARLYRNRFLRAGTVANAALALVALIESDDETFIVEKIPELDSSPLCHALVDQWYRDVQEGDTSVAGIQNFSLLHLIARAYTAGLIARDRLGERAPSAA